MSPKRIGIGGEGFYIIGTHQGLFIRTDPKGIGGKCQKYGSRNENKLPVQ